MWAWMPSLLKYLKVLLVFYHLEENIKMENEIFIFVANKLFLQLEEKNQENT